MDGGFNLVGFFFFWRIVITCHMDQYLTWYNYVQSNHIRQDPVVLSLVSGLTLSPILILPDVNFSLIYK